MKAYKKVQNREETLREEMVEEQIIARGIKQQEVLDALRRVPRHEFVPASLSYLAYADQPLPIGEGQTISQPYIVAYMTEILKLTSQDRVLEIGTGSGYQCAVLAEIAKEVYTMEIEPSLHEKAKEVCQRLGYRNIHLRLSNGYAGWPEAAPFSKIIVTAAPMEVPQALIEQLARGGRMVVPMGVLFQQLMVIEKLEDGRLLRKTDLPVRFVPMRHHEE
ncbi:MAG: protein-L-isoaspartate(D-aspartate) O-methyltransferase [Deltaproteobacteria bacterium]|nr:protein-L-isoaspartate(D-aspartate) O-methyltransferase [Deltaproteobacteria bacterium]